MNYYGEYGEQALLPWRVLPASYAKLEDPVRFFAYLGEQADAEIEGRYQEYARVDVPARARRISKHA